MANKTQDYKTTKIKITFGFGTNKFGYSNIYRRGIGKDLPDAIKNLFRQRGNNSLPADQKVEIVSQIRKTLAKLDENDYLKNDPATEKMTDLGG